MNQDYKRSDRRIYLASSTVVIILALAAGILSYSALKTLAVMSGINPILALLFPLVIDGLILSGTLLVLFFAVRGRRSFFGIFLTLLGVVASIAGNVAVSDNNLIHQIVHGAPALVLFLSLEALTILLRTRFKENTGSFLTGKTADNSSKDNTEETHKENNEKEDIEEKGSLPSNEPPHEEAYFPVHVESSSESPQTSQDAPESAGTSLWDSSPLDDNEALTRTPVNPQGAPELPKAIRTQPSTIMLKENTSVEKSPVSVTKRETQAKPPAKKKSPKQTIVEVDDDFKYVVIEGTKREQIENLLEQNPDIRPKTVTEIIGGDRSYNSKLLREIRG